MATTKDIGICMDHESASLMELKNDEIITKSITSDFTHLVKETTISKSEHVMHNKEQQQQSSYYNNIKDIAKEYDRILLFGPTKAKNELLNILNKDRHFEKAKIDVVDSDKMTETQQHIFIKNHFQS